MKISRYYPQLFLIIGMFALALVTEKPRVVGPVYDITRAPASLEMSPEADSLYGLIKADFQLAADEVWKECSQLNESKAQQSCWNSRWKIRVQTLRKTLGSKDGVDLSSAKNKKWIDEALFWPKIHTEFEMRTQVRAPAQQKSNP